MVFQVNEENNAELWWDTARERAAPIPTWPPRVNEAVWALLFENQSRIVVPLVESAQVLAWFKKIPGWGEKGCTALDVFEEEVGLLQWMHCHGVCGATKDWIGRQIEKQVDQHPLALWQACRDPSWLLWAITRLDPARGVLVACLCWKARLSGCRHYETFVSTDEEALDLIAAWVWGEEGDDALGRAKALLDAGDSSFRHVLSRLTRAATFYNNWEASNLLSSSLDYPEELCDLIRSAVPLPPGVNTPYWRIRSKSHLGDVCYYTGDPERPYISVEEMSRAYASEASVQAELTWSKEKYPDSSFWKHAEVYETK
jgi:hypothetical protein